MSHVSSTAGDAMDLAKALALADHASPTPEESLRALRILRERIGTLEDTQLKSGHLPIIDQKYNEVLLPFARMMARELHANSDKGDRPGWLQMSPAVGMLEIYYHAAKLQKAVKDCNIEGIREFAADVANMSMMLLDVHGGLENIDPIKGEDHQTAGVSGSAP